jgi:hypothetical protein
MKLSKRKQEIEARKASDPISQLMEREDVDYSSDELPTAPRKDSECETKGNSETTTN